MQTATDRQTLILEFLTRHGDVEVDELSRRLGVSPSTVRRELRTLQGSGLLVRGHGRARLPTPVAYEAPYESRAATQLGAKRAVAAVARRLIQPGSVIGISGGTTCAELARQLRAFSGPLTIVTNAMNVAMELHGQTNKRVVVTGGYLQETSYELTGDLVTGSLQDIHLDIAFLGCSGVEPHFGFSMSDHPEAAVGQAFLSITECKVVIADSTKIGRATFARLCRLADVSVLITDEAIPANDLSALRDAGLKVVVAEPLEVVS